MAGRNRRWNRALFPIDDALIERLIDDWEGRAQGSAPERRCVDDDFEVDADCGSNPSWRLEVGPSGAPMVEDLLADDAREAVLGDELAVNMRVLDDYLRRRLIDEPDTTVPTLH